MRISDKGLALIQLFEGLKLEAYQDTGGVWTIGVGHTRTAKEDMRITVSEAKKLLSEDVKEAEQALNTLVKVPLNQNQFDALVSFVFNVGASQFQNSTLLKLLNAGDYDGAAEQLSRWVYDNGRKLKGLVRRRAEEMKLFRTGDLINV